MKHSNFSVKACTVFSFFLFFQTCLSASAQEDFKPKLGLIDRASVEMKAYPGDSTADAVVLYDYGEVSFASDLNRGIVIRNKIWVRIKILRESALNMASVSLPYYEGSKLTLKEKVENLSGYVYNLDGNEIITSKLDKNTVQIEKSADSYFIQKFNLPNVKKGSVIEYTYTKTSPFAVLHTPKTWNFQGPVPIKWSEYNVTIPAFLEYHITLGGYLPFYINESEVVDVDVGQKMLNGKGTAYRLVVKDAPAFVDEPFITTPADYISKVSFEPSAYKIGGLIGEEFAGTWDQIDWKFRRSEHFDEEYNTSLFGKEIPAQLLSTMTGQKEKMEIGYNYIRKTVKWDEEIKLTPVPELKKAYQNRKGNSAAVNLLLLNLLRKAGLECDPVVLSTRAHGRIFKDFPTLESFNYVVCRVKIDSVEYLLDATQKFARPGVLPEFALNGWGRVIPKIYQGHFQDIVPIDSRSTLEMVEADFSPEDGTLRGSYSASLGGYLALEWREQYAQEPDKSYLEDFKKRFPEWEITNLNVSNKIEKLDAAVNVKCEFQTDSENYFPGVHYFNPIVVGKMLKNPLTSQNRIYPVDFTTNQSSSFIGTFKLPDGYLIDEMPKSEIITLPGNVGRFLYQVKQNGNIIHVTSKVMLNKLRFLPEEYADLREFFERVVSKHAQQIVIKKKDR